MSATVENLNTYFGRAQAKSAGLTYDPDRIDEIALREEVLQEIYPNIRFQGNKAHLGSLRGEAGNSFVLNMSNGWWEEHNPGDVKDGIKKGKGIINLVKARMQCSKAEATSVVISLIEKVTDEVIPKRKGAEVVKLVTTLAPEEFEEEPLVLKSRYAAQETKRYHYYDADGKLIGIRVRMEPPNASKQIKPFIYKLRSEDDEGGWTCEDLPFATKPLYNLPELYANMSKDVLFVEGEKAVEAAKIRFPHVVPITGWGASGNYSHLDFHPLVGRKVTVWPDKDPAGFKAQQTLIQALEEMGVRVRVVEVPDFFPDMWDLADPNPPGVTDKQLADMLSDAPDGMGEEAICKNLILLTNQDKYYDLASRQVAGDSLLEKMYTKFVDKITKRVKSSTFVRQVFDVTYLPSKAPFEIVQEEDGRKRLNLYDPNIIEPLDEEPKDFFLHLSLLFRDETLKNNFVWFLAHCCQHPGVKLNWATLMIGPNGIGKSYYGKLMASIFRNDARALAASILSETSFTGTSIKDCHFICFDELESNEDKNNVTLKLKNWMDSKTLEISIKRENLYFVPNVLNFMLTSNNEKPLNFDASDRRYFVLNFYDMMLPAPYEHLKFNDINVKECYPGLFERLFSEEEMRRIYNYLLKQKIPEDFYKMNRAPDSVFKTTIIGESRSKLETILNEAMNGSDPIPPFEGNFFLMKEVRSFLEENKHIKQVLTEHAIRKALLACGATCHGQKSLGKQKAVTVWSPPGRPGTIDGTNEFDVEACKAQLKLRHHVFA